MSDNLKDFITLLEDNEESIKKEARRLLLRICHNILKNPQEPKFRKIFLANETVTKKLLPATGAIQCLFAIGFTEDDNGFLLPNQASLSKVKELYNLLSGVTQQPPKPQPVLNPPKIQAPTTSNIRVPVIQEDNQSGITREHRNFFIRLADHFKDVLKYEDDFLLDKARVVLPLEMLQIQALEKMRIFQREMKLKQLDIPLSFDDLVLNEMLIWFKEKFFTWVDSPQCDRCTGECKFSRVVRSYHRKISRIEVHKCTVCGDENQFPRYSDPECLLYTRKGRCGEWANCFTLFCRVAKYDARIVYDETDHVWTEVWSDYHQKWMHLDPCESALDCPLMYEKGWGKKLSYVIAFSKDEIMDVTWRYTRNSKDVMKRRNYCREEALTLFIEKMNNIRQSDPSYSAARRKYVLKRASQELADMVLAPPGCTKPNEVNEKTMKYDSRQSGSLSWKIARGEVGDSHKSYTPYQWKIPKGVNNYELSYYIILDKYTVKDVAKNKIIVTKEKWRSGVDSIEGGMFRKEERDWKVAYLARLPVNPTSKITWTIVVEDKEKDLKGIDSVKFRTSTATFHGANITWEIKGTFYKKDKSENDVKVLPIPNCENFETKDLAGAMQIEISATLSGGEGEQSWQHAQLFRESMASTSKVPSMVIQISLK